MDHERFAHAAALAAERQRLGIGMLGEKGIHNALKHYYEPDPTCHEVSIGGYVADIVGENGIIEIQTRSFGSMHDKLARFLEASTRVTIVYPCIVNKRVFVHDPDTGELLYKRRSPRHGSKFDLLTELWGILDLWDHERLDICITFIDADEFRPKQEKRGRRKRKGGARPEVERLPTALLDELWLCSPADYAVYFPDTLPEQFLSKDYRAATGLSQYDAGMAVSLFFRMGLIERIGKQGNAYVYRLCIDRDTI